MLPENSSFTPLHSDLYLNQYREIKSVWDMNKSTTLTNFFASFFFTPRKKTTHMINTYSMSVEKSIFLGLTFHQGILQHNSTKFLRDENSSGIDPVDV